LTCCDLAVALEKASGSGVSAKKHIFSGLLARARERNTMLARERNTMLARERKKKRYTSEITTSSPLRDGRYVSRCVEYNDSNWGSH